MLEKSAKTKNTRLGSGCFSEKAGTGRSFRERSDHVENVHKDDDADRNAEQPKEDAAHVKLPVR